MLRFVQVPRKLCQAGNPSELSTRFIPLQFTFVAEVGTIGLGLDCSFLSNHQSNPWLLTRKAIMIAINRQSDTILKVLRNSGLVKFSCSTLEKVGCYFRCLREMGWLLSRKTCPSKSSTFFKYDALPYVSEISKTGYYELHIGEERAQNERKRSSWSYMGNKSKVWFRFPDTMKETK